CWSARRSPSSRSSSLAAGRRALLPRLLAAPRGQREPDESRILASSVSVDPSVRREHRVLAAARDAAVKDGADIDRQDSASRRRLLFLAPSPPRLDATHGGSRMVAQLVSLLAPRHDIALLCLRFPDEPPVDDVVRERCDVVEEVHRPLLARSPWRLLRETRRLRLFLA